MSVFGVLPIFILLNRLKMVAISMSTGIFPAFVLGILNNKNGQLYEDVSHFGSGLHFLSRYLM